jgi:hypothetical protein
MHQTGICQSSYGAQFRINKKGKPRLWLIVGHIAIQRRIPGTSPFFSHDSPPPVNSLYDRIAIQGHGPEFEACRQLLQPRIQFRKIEDTGEEEIVGVSRNGTKKRLLKSEGRKAVRQTSPLYCAMLQLRWVGSGFFQTLLRLPRACPAPLMINPVQLLHVLF